MTARERQRDDAATPSAPPNVTPSVYPGSDYSFTLQAVHDLQGRMGKIEQAIETLTDESRENGKKLSHISHVVYAVGAVVTVVGAIAGYVLKGVWDIIEPILRNHLH
jgi:hypothetical protein